MYFSAANISLDDSRQCYRLKLIYLQAAIAYLVISKATCEKMVFTHLATKRGIGVTSALAFS